MSSVCAQTPTWVPAACLQSVQTLLAGSRNAVPRVGAQGLCCVPFSHLPQLQGGQNEAAETQPFG